MNNNTIPENYILPEFSFEHYRNLIIFHQHANQALQYLQIFMFERAYDNVLLCDFLEQGKSLSNTIKKWLFSNNQSVVMGD